MTMQALAQWFLYRLEWDEAAQKYKKQPCSMDGQQWPVSAPSVMSTHAVAVDALTRLGQGYVLGFWFTASDPYFLFDLDKVIAGGVVTAHAQEMLTYFKGAMVEKSSSGTGLHIIGRYSGTLPPHRNKSPKEQGLNYEFYCQDRGVAFGYDEYGNADHDCTALLAQMLPTYFPPRPVGEAGSVRRTEWRGPEDDDVLIARMLGAKQSAAVVAGGGVGLQRLWAGECEKNSESDMALAGYLAWWTGNDGDRIERLMLRSGLVRDKWFERRGAVSYLRTTIEHACAGTAGCYQEPERDRTALREAYGLQAASVSIAAPVTVIHADMGRQVEQFVLDINAAVTYSEIIDTIVPRIAGFNVPTIYVDRLVGVLNRKLDFFDAKMPVGKLRALINPPRVANVMGAPEWCMRHCFVTKTDKFYDLQSGAELSRLGFYARYAQMMPQKPNGDREDPVKWALEKWNMVSVDDWAYHPQRDSYFEWAGRSYVNKFVISSIPVAATAYSAQGVEAIHMFNDHLMHLCGGRADVHAFLLKWIAHNVQFPGRKIRWSPLIKGIPGDGKSIIGDVLRAALGDRNVKITSNSTLKANGGFTDWAIGSAVNMIEETRLIGSARYELFENLKNFIDLAVVNINPKGKTTFDVPNTTNHMGNTNYNDGLPLDLTDRRWMIVFSPYSHIEEACRDKGLSTPDDLVMHFKKIGDACRAVPGEMRAWLMGIDLSDFNPDGRAPWTAEKERMVASARDGIEELIDDVLHEGGRGITVEAFSSAALQSRVRLKAMSGLFEIPNSIGWNHTLARMGYEKLPKVVKWDGGAHRVWAKNNFKGDWEKIKAVLETTK